MPVVHETRKPPCTPITRSQTCAVTDRSSVAWLFPAALYHTFCAVNNTTRGQNFCVDPTAPYTVGRLDVVYGMNGTVDRRIVEEVHQVVTGTMTMNRNNNHMMQFVGQYANTGLKRDLLLFWRKHPFAKFTSGGIAGAVDRNRRVDVEEALECFVEAELVEKHMERGQPLYCLSSDSSKRWHVLNMPVFRIRLGSR
jgi:hypothetical protein